MIPLVLVDCVTVWLRWAVPMCQLHRCGWVWAVLLSLHQGRQDKFLLASVGMPSLKAETECDEPQIELQDTQKIVQCVAEMNITSPEVSRVTWAFRVFQQCAFALRAGCDVCDVDFYFKSERVEGSEKISTFWSHSWHGGHWKKIITLIIAHHHIQSVFQLSLAFFRMLFALLVMLLILFCLNTLPDLHLGKTGEIQHGYSCWFV
jgi:hypothetical protein